jgi:hypothetical protein
MNWVTTGVAMRLLRRPSEEGLLAKTWGTKGGRSIERPYVLYIRLCDLFFLFPFFLG